MIGAVWQLLTDAIEGVLRHRHTSLDFKNWIFNKWKHFLFFKIRVGYCHNSVFYVKLVLTSKITRVNGETSLLSFLLCTRNGLVILSTLLDINYFVLSSVPSVLWIMMCLFFRQFVFKYFISVKGLTIVTCESWENY